VLCGTRAVIVQNESDEKNGWGVKTESWDRGDQVGASSLGHM